MGRTARRRKRRRKECFHNIEDEYVLFQKWITTQGWKQTVKLKLKHFPNIGHGLMAMEPIKCGDILVKIPANVLITARTVSNSYIGEIFMNSATKVPVHLIFTAFIIYQKHLGIASHWSEYISVLPSSFLSPLFCNSDELSSLPEFVVEKVTDLKKRIENMYIALQLACESQRCNHCSAPLSDIFQNDIFLWAWFTVNSRVVFISPSLNLSHSLPLSDCNSIALAPYLDMLNHSNSAKVVATFCPESGYVLKTLMPFRKFEQVFIHYGDHDNLKLFIDYGFVLPDNENNTIILSVNDVTRHIKYSSLKTIEATLSFISKNCPEFLKDLYIYQDGLSWNFKVLIYLFSSPGSINLKLALQHIYAGTFEERCSNLCNIGMLIIEEKIKEIRGYIEKLDSFKETNILQIGRQMLDSYIKTLECAQCVLA